MSQTSSTLEHTTGQAVEHVDVLIVGAGISGIGAGYHLQDQYPEKSFVILEKFESFGGTWLTHKYPGIRSDSDLYTFGYRFKPWIGPPIATADKILAYMGEVIEENVKSREVAAQEAEVLIAQGVQAFMLQLRSLGATETLLALRSKAESIRDQELDKALKQLGQGKDAEQVLQQLARGLTNKLIHSPSVRMKQAAAEGRTELLELTHELFELALDTP
jgi:monoamine oxidase